MDGTEFSQRFDVLYNNITSNQAPGLNEYEKSVFLTEGQDLYIKEQFYAANNTEQAGYDNNRKRYTDFAGITRTVYLPVEKLDADSTYEKLDPRALVYRWPKDVLFVVNEQLDLPIKGDAQHPYQEQRIRQLLPIAYNEYSRLMSKPFKQPNKYQAWRILTDYIHQEATTNTDAATNKDLIVVTDVYEPLVEVILNYKDRKAVEDSNKEQEKEEYPEYILRYIKIPNPIITVNLQEEYGEDLKINGQSGPSQCELHASTHEEILQKAVYLAKLAWEGAVQPQAVNRQRRDNND